MAIDSVTIHLPDDLYQRLEHLATLTHQPLEALIVQTLSATLPPLPEDLSPEIRDSLRRLEALDDEALREVARATLPDDQYTRLTDLREERRARALSASETSEIEHLLHAADVLTLEKAYASVLLTWRGHPLPRASGAGG